MNFANVVGDFKEISGIDILDRNPEICAFDLVKLGFYHLTHTLLFKYLFHANK